MLRRRSLVLGPFLLLTGCLPLQLLDPSGTESGTPLVPTSPFGTAAPVEAKAVSVAYTQAPWGTSARVDRVGCSVRAANPSIGVKPIFATSAVAHAEIFHVAPHTIHITEGLVKQCKTDGELAAVICLELAKMVSEREAQSGTRGHGLDEPPPIEVPIGNAGQFTASDQVAVAELARYEAARKRRGGKHLPPDPHALARGYLEKAGYDRRELDAAAPVLEAAEKNYILEKQFKPAPSAPGWAPVSAQ
jgi:hypothetical protein